MRPPERPATSSPPSPDDDVGQALAFLRGRFPEDLPGGVITLCERDGAGGALRVVGAYPVEEAGLAALALDAVVKSAVNDTWVLVNALGGYPPRGRKGSEVGLRYLAGLHEDIDKGIEDPLSFLDGLGEWRPSLVVESGHGVHAYWLWDGVVDLAEEAGSLERLAETRGGYRLLGARWHRFLEQEAGAGFDDVSNLDRIMRLPGTWNRKRQGAVPVRVARADDGRRFRPESVKAWLDERGVEARVGVGGAGDTRGYSADELREAFARQGSLGEEESRDVVTRLVPVYVHRANTYANASRSRNRALYDLAQQLNDHGVPREAAVEAVLGARVMVTEYTEEGERDPLTVEEVMTSVESAYSLPPRGGARMPVSEDSGLVTGWVGGGAETGSSPELHPVEGSAAGGDGGVVVPLVRVTGEKSPNRDTDRANGNDLAALCRGRLKWTAGGRADGGWLRWSGIRWEEDAACDRFKLVDELVRNLESRAISAGDDERKVLLKRARRLEMNGGRNAALDASRDNLAVATEKLDRKIYLLNTPTGAVNLETGTLQAHNPEDLITRVTPVSYVPGARHPLWEEVLDIFLPEPASRAWVQKMAGYCLTGSVGEKALVCLMGQKNSGKSSISNAMFGALGDVDHGGYACTWEAEVIQAGDFNRAEKIAQARPARLVVAAEMKRGSKMAESFMKRVVGGDILPGRALYGASFNYKPMFKLWLHTNYIPLAPDDALHDRLRLMRFKHSIPSERRDQRVNDALTSEPEIQQAVLAWAVEGCVRWQAEALGLPPGHEAEMSRYTLESDPVRRFMEEVLEPSPDQNLWVSRAQVIELYRAWVAREGAGRALGRTTLLAALAERGCATDRVMRAGQRTYVLLGQAVRGTVHLGNFGLTLAEDDGNHAPVPQS